MKISTILDKIDENQLFVPAFQREYVWKRDDAKLLIDSLIKEYPTGTMLTWETANPPELKGGHEYNSNQGAVKILLDGQQRVTTLYLLMKGQIPPYYTAADISNDTRGLFVNLETLELSYYMKLRMENNPFWQDITDVFQGKVNPFALQPKLQALGKELGMDELQKLNNAINTITRIRDRDFPEQTIPVKATIREAIDIFYKVNASGVALTDAELALAQITGYWPQARQRFKSKLAEMEQNGFQFGLDWLVYVLLGCLHHMGSDMRRLHGQENRKSLQDAWTRLDTQVLDYVVNLLKAHAFVDHSKEINSPYSLVPIIVYCFDKQGKHLTETEIRKMVKWFYYSQLRARYVSQLQQKLDRDLRILAESTQPFDDLLQIIAEESRLEISPSEFAGRAIQHPLFSLMRWYFKSRGAVCFTTGMSLRKNMGAKYQLEFDHIFPFSRLKAAGYGKQNRLKYSLAQELTNRAILTQVANRSKSDANAEDYLQGIKERFPKALKLQSVPEDENLWKLENYEKFLEARRELLATQLNAYLEGITGTEEAGEAVSIEDLIKEGESDELEFKSTLRWDLQQGVVNRKLEEVIVKTVAAFGNSQGGTLLIGVDDDGNIIGLEHDYLTLESGNRDKFELHCRNLLSQHFDISMITNRIQITFHEVDNKDVCQIDVEPATKPLILKVKDKNGQQFEKFYLRSGNASQEVALSEMTDYLRERFR
jgi:hypothetical protein